MLGFTEEFFLAAYPKYCIRNSLNGDGVDLSNGGYNKQVLQCPALFMMKVKAISCYFLFCLFIHLPVIAQKLQSILPYTRFLVFASFVAELRDMQLPEIFKYGFRTCISNNTGQQVVIKILQPAGLVLVEHPGHE